MAKIKLNKIKFKNQDFSIQIHIFLTSNNKTEKNIMTEDFQKSSTHWGIGISEQYGFSMRKGASHFGLMITGQGSNRLKASNSIMSTIASFGKSSWITLSVAWRSSFLSQWGMPPKIQSRERLYKYTLQWALSSSFKKKNCQREERTPPSEDQHSSRWFSNWGWLGHN